MARKIALSAKPDHFVGTSDNDWVLGDGGDDTISGRAGDDRLVGGEGDDRLSGGSGRDTLAGGAGVNVVDGGRGRDTVILHGTYADAEIYQDGDGWIIETTQGTTTTWNIERFRFADGTKAAGEMESEPFVEDYFLTISADDVFGTSLGDIMLGGPGTLNSDDVLDGGWSGYDLLRLGPGAIETGAAPALRSIELIEDADGSGLNLANATGVERVVAYAASASYINASLAATFVAASDVDQIVSIDYSDLLAGASDTAAVATSLSTAATVEFDFGTDAAGIENVKIDTAAIAAGGVSIAELDADLSGLKTIIITGTGDAVIRSNGVGHLASGALASFDASAATGDIAAGLNGQAGVTITFGAGDDTLTALGTEQGLAITLGAGEDRLALADLTNIVDADEADFVEDIMTITYFRASHDVIDLTAVSVSRAQLSDAQQIILEGAGSLFAAVTTVAGYTDADELLVFDYGNKTYAYLQDGDAGFDAGDGLIELSGVSAANLDTTNLLI